MADIGQAVLRGRNLGRFAAVLGAGAVFFLYWQFFLDHSPVVRTAQAKAVVLEVKEKAWQVRLPTDETLWMGSFPGVAVKQGEVIPILIETQESGRRVVRLERDRWAGGPP